MMTPMIRSDRRSNLTSRAALVRTFEVLTFDEVEANTTKAANLRAAGGEANRIAAEGYETEIRVGRVSFR